MRNLGLTPISSFPGPPRGEKCSLPLAHSLTMNVLWYFCCSKPDSQAQVTHLIQEIPFITKPELQQSMAEPQIILTLTYI